MPITTTGAGGFAAPSAPSFTTFDPANKSSNVTLSGGNLVVTCTGSGGEGRTVRTIASHATGKYYAEFTLTTASSSGSDGLGAVNATFAIGDNATYIGEDATSRSVGCYSDGKVYRGGTSAIATIMTFTTADVVCMAVDCDNERIWWRKGGGNWNNDVSANPATNTNGIDASALGGGALYACVEPEGNGDVWTANFGATAYAQTAPSGFVNW